MSDVLREKVNLIARKGNKFGFEGIESPELSRLRSAPER